MTAAEVLARLDLILARGATRPQEPAGDPDRPVTLRDDRIALGNFERAEEGLP